MKRNERICRVAKIFGIAAIAAAMPVLQGCTEEPIAESPLEDNDGKRKISLNIDFKLSGMEEKTLSAPVSKSGEGFDDSLLEDINLYVTDEYGELVYHRYSEESLDFEVEAHDKREYCIYAIANAGKKIAARSAEEIEWLSLSIPDISYIRSNAGAVLMSGKTDPLLLDSATAITVYLTRCVAKVNLKADYSQLSSDVEITVNSVELKNVPSKMSLFKENRILSPDISITGDTRYAPTTEDLAKGITFYQFENMQGTLLPDNNSQTGKVWPEGSLYSKVCSYLELQATYSSPRKTGNILYRFYLGNDMLKNFDIKRNTQLNITVNFKGDGAVDENTWRVDNSEIMDLVTGVSVSPENYTFTELGASLQLSATVSPSTAYNSAVTWSSTNASVAEVDASGKVTAISEGECSIYATSTDGTEISGCCNITVNEPEFLELQFASGSYNMYDGQKHTFPFSAVSTYGRAITCTSSNGNIIKVISASEAGVEVEALAPGEATITAQVGEKTTSCKITVDKLEIIAAETDITTHNHYYADLEYTISPAYAADDFSVTITPSEAGITTGYGGIANRIIPQYEASVPLPASPKITLSLSGRPDVSTEIALTVKPMIDMVPSIKINANKGNSESVNRLELKHHPRGRVTKYRWTPADGKKYYGDPGEENADVQLFYDKIVFPVPTAANGLYRLETSITGDDGYGSSWEPDATAYCEITVYETVYLVGVSKTVDRNKVAGTTDTWEYENEIVAKWLSHPNSLIFPQGILPLELGFRYNGKSYTSNETGETRIYTFRFTKGDTVPLVLESEGMLYNGTPPQYFLEYFSLEPDGSAYREGNPATGEPYLYIYSRSFISGFTRNSSPDWKRIFEFIYP